MLKEVAAYLRVTPRTLRVWVQRGKFPPPIRPGEGKRRLWRWSEVEQILSQLAQRPTTKKGTRTM
jgi:DNA-binding transcriptional MerR regulator